MGKDKHTAMRLFYGTGNQAKFKNMESMTAGLGLELISPQRLGISLPVVEEDGATPWDIAQKKAEAYYCCTGLPSMGLDSGLYLEGVPRKLQPGTHVRRIGGKSLSDEEFIEYYCKLAADYGGKIRARFINGICVVMDKKHKKIAGGPFVSSSWFWITDRPHTLRVAGFPMDSIAVYPGTDHYWVEGLMEDERHAKGAGLEQGIRQFFIELLSDDYTSCVDSEFI